MVSFAFLLRETPLPEHADVRSGLAICTTLSTTVARFGTDDTLI
jgi:hypothetical protein